jgi:tetrahydromethanopterin S-methyltransferase subunit F
MPEASKRDSLLEIVFVLFVLLYFSSELLQGRNAQLAAGIQSALFLGLAAALYRFAGRGPGMRWLVGSGVLLGLEVGTRAVGMTPGTMQSVMLIGAAICLTIGVVFQVRRARGGKTRQGATSTDSAT